MIDDVLCQLARRFVAGELEQVELGSVVVAMPRRTVIASSLGTVELERDEEGTTFAFHAWPAPAPFDAEAWTRELGTPTRPARRGPDDPMTLQFLPANGIVIVEIEDERAVALHAYRFAASSLAGAITTEPNLIALLELVGGNSFTLDNVQNYLGRARKRDDWRIELDPRPGSNLQRATIELSGGTPHGLQLTFAQPIDLDFNVLRTRFGRERFSIDGNPPSFRKTYTFDGGIGRLMLDTYEEMRGDRCKIGEAVVRRVGNASDSLEITQPKARRVPAALGPDRVVALVDAMFERGIDAAATHVLLGEPIATSGGRTRLQPYDADLDGAVLHVRGDRTTLEIELAETSALDPTLLEPHFGASREVPPLHAHAQPARRFHVRNARYTGYVLVAPDRVTLHRAPHDAWLGDFARPEDLVTLIQRFVDNPRLPLEDVYALVGDPGHQIEFDEDRRCVKIVPFAGSNAHGVNVHFRESRRIVSRIELLLHASRAVDFGDIARVEPFEGPSGSLLKMDIIQYEARFGHGRVLLNTVDQRPGPIRLVRSMILDKG
jgi:hypothetical protein